MPFLEIIIMAWQNLPHDDLERTELLHSDTEISYVCIEKSDTSGFDVSMPTQW